MSGFVPDEQQLFQGGSIAALSAVVGSFLAVVVMRSAMGKQWWAGRSRCDGCDAVLGWNELVPVFGYLAARGRCQNCGMAIPRACLAVEVAGVVGALMAWWRFEGLELAFALLLGWQLLLLATFDALTGRLPRALNFGLGLSGLLAQVVLFGDWLLPLVGVAIAGAMLMLIAWLYQRVRGREGLGLGDIMLLAGAGSWLGPERIAPALLIGAIVGLGCWWLGSRRPHSPSDAELIPFAPALAAGIWISFLYVT